MRIWQTLLCLALAASALGCEVSGVHTDASTPTSPGGVPAEPVVNIGGTWVGTLESANMAPIPISMVVVQFGNCVDGSWRSAGGEWTGGISGLAGTNSYTGQMSFERPSGSGGSCLARAEVSGDVGSDTLSWTGAGPAPLGPCTGDLPRSIVVNLRRQ